KKGSGGWKMRYENNGVEIQYRECQILRDAAKELLAGGEDTKNLVDQRDKWIQAIRDIAEASEAKGKFAIPAAQFLSGMKEEYLEAVAEYTISLIRKGKGIDIMVPFTASNKRLILPVNTHASVWEEYQGAEMTERD
ncbi:MAG: hypothetical protein K2G55_00110, partial [Lachnospiraceae bacterium]|nr:hypothetical protein [Lachnospiraceae bacterium]